ncbi:uncharacterized protein K460DRAFT_251180, partial [Cucurbitaria berberidis CBS 394.84]
NAFEDWEKQERRIAQAQAKMHVQKLGVTWDQFVHDVERTSKEVHFLTPTRYEAPPISLTANRDAETTNNLHAYNAQRPEYGAVGEHEAWKKLQEVHVNALDMFARAR